MRKRLITAALALALVLSLFPAQALATEEPKIYQIGDTLEVEGTNPPTVEIVENARWEQQGDAVQKAATEPSCGHDEHIHGDGNCDLYCSKPEHEHLVGCPEDCAEEHEHTTGICAGEGVCETEVHTHGDGNCFEKCSLEEHEHETHCYEEITYTTWILVSDEGDDGDEGDESDEGDEGDEGDKGDEGSEDDKTPQCPIEEDHLFAYVVNENGDNAEHIHFLECAPGETKKLRFFYGTEDNSNSLSMDEIQYSRGELTITPGDSWLVVGPVSASTKLISYRDSSFSVIGTLPNYGFYSQPDRNAENLVTGYNNAAGKTVSVYLLWAAGCNKPASITATNNGESLELQSVTITDTYAEVTFAAPASGSVIFEIAPENSSSLTIELQDKRAAVSETEDHLVTLDYEGTPVTVGFGINPLYILLNVDGGFSTQEDNQEHMLYLGALMNFGTHEEIPAPQAFYDKISDVVFSIKEFRNTAGNSTTCNGSFVEDASAEVVVDNLRTRGNVLTYEPGKLFDATLAMSFQYEGCSYELNLYFTYNSTDVALDASDLDTAEKLNAVLSSSESLLNWFKSKDEAAFNRYNQSRAGFIDIYLPAVEYKDIIVSNLIPSMDSRIYHNCVRLHGHKEGTVMPGLHSKGGIWFVDYIDFIADKNHTMTFDNKSFTCGVLAEGGLSSNSLGISSSSITGFDYGVRSTATGHVSSVYGTDFIDCNDGVYVDCTRNPVVTSDTAHYGGNYFNNCKVALTIRNHPNRSTPYATYVSDNNFINCKKDFKITTPGNPHYYHFTKNYYGNASLARTADSYASRTVSIDTEEGNPNAVIVTNPRRVSHDSGILGIDDTPGLYSMIFNSESADLKINGDELKKIKKATKVQILGNDENTIASWIFGG